MNGYAREYLIGRAEAAAQTAGEMFSTLPTFAESSIKLSYCYLLAANGKIEEAMAYLKNQTPDLMVVFTSALQNAEEISKSTLI